jgi:predicted DNA-binding protein
MKNEKRFEMRISERQLAKLNELARTQSLPASAVVRIIISDYIKKHEHVLRKSRSKDSN